MLSANIQLFISFYLVYSQEMEIESLCMETQNANISENVRAVLGSHLATIR